MNQLTLEQALELVHPWLGTWHPKTQCLIIANSMGRHWCCAEYGWWDKPPKSHDIPMPPATDELAMRVLRQWSNGIGWEIMRESIHRELQREYDIRDAIIIAAAMWLQSRKGKTA